MNKIKTNSPELDEYLNEVAAVKKMFHILESNIKFGFKHTLAQPLKTSRFNLITQAEKDILKTLEGAKTEALKAIIAPKGVELLKEF